jgi:putative ABC transport system ATP-binding protein
MNLNDATDTYPSEKRGSPVIRATEIAKARGDHPLWKGVTFRVEAGSSLAITGPSGAGKSTLLNCIGLLEKPDAGTIELLGTETTGIALRNRRDLFRRVVGHLFQNYGLVDSWSVDRNLDVTFSGSRVPRHRRASLREIALERVGLEGYGKRRTYSLSGGEQQRVALARLLLKKPLIIAADEPSAALDDDNTAIVLSILAELRATGSAVVIATHDENVAGWCDGRLRLGAKT